MQVIFSKTFTKSYKKLDEKIKSAFGKKLEIFLQNEFDPILRNHMLKGNYEEIRSISITGDFRAHYIILETKDYYFVAIGSHSELYDK